MKCLSVSNDREFMGRRNRLPIFLLATLAMLLILAASDLVAQDETKEPDPIFVVKRPWREPTHPDWVSADAAQVGGKLNEDLFRWPRGLRRLLNSQPVDPESGCIPYGKTDDVFPDFLGFESSRLVAHLKITHAVPGFLGGFPGTLFRGTLAGGGLLRKPVTLEDQQVFDFFMLSGRVPLEDKVICADDRRFPHDLRVGDEAIIFSADTFVPTPSESFVEIGYGGVLAFRDGWMLLQGEAQKRLKLSDSREKTLEIIRGKLAKEAE